VLTRSDAREVARARYEEACLVRDSYGAQVIKRRRAWRTAPDGRAANAARRGLAEAVAQHEKAKEDVRAAWWAWHALQ
jgi:hypothetical protein